MRAQWRNTLMISQSVVFELYRQVLQMPYITIRLSICSRERLVSGEFSCISKNFQLTSNANPGTSAKYSDGFLHRHIKHIGLYKGGTSICS